MTSPRPKADDRPVKLTNPEYCPGRYSLHAYCKYSNPAHSLREFPHEPQDCETYGEAVAALRSEGWIMHRDNTATCPKCARALKAGRSALAQHQGGEHG